MTPDKVVRTTLWVTVAFNAVAAYGVAYPASLVGQLMGLPTEVPALYSVLLAWMVAAFGGMYAWLALQKVISRPLVGFSGIAKSGVFILTFLLWISGHIGGMAVLITTGDLLFASIFFWWLIKTARYAGK